MKENIHPKYKEITVTCSCGNTFETSSTSGKDKLHIEICAKCHPFYTGKQKVMDTGGRIKKFEAKFGKKLGAKTDEKTKTDKAHKTETHHKTDKTHHKTDDNSAAPAA